MVKKIILTLIILLSAVIFYAPKPAAAAGACKPYKDGAMFMYVYTYKDLAFPPERAKQPWPQYFWCPPNGQCSYGTSTGNPLDAKRNDANFCGYSSTVQPAPQIRNDDNSKEAEIHLDYIDDWAQKDLAVPSRITSQEEPVDLTLWIYGRGFGERTNANPVIIKVNNGPVISFNPIDKFGTNFSWQSFDIPGNWLRTGTNTFYIQDSSHWTHDNLTLGIDTSRSGTSSGCYFDGITTRCVEGELMIYLAEPVPVGVCKLARFPITPTNHDSFYPFNQPLTNPISPLANVTIHFDGDRCNKNYTVTTDSTGHSSRLDVTRSVWNGSDINTINQIKYTVWAETLSGYQFSRGNYFFCPKDCNEFDGADKSLTSQDQPRFTDIDESSNYGLNFRFGFMPKPFTISGNVFLDNNKNKVMDQGESCYNSSVTIAVYPATGGATDFYNFPSGCNYVVPKQYTDPPKWSLYLKDVPAGYFVTINPTNIGPSNSTNVNFGIKQITTVTGARKRVFVTSQVYKGNLGGLAGADQKCQDRANTANLGGTWKAWISDDNTSASSRLNHDNIPYALLNGQQIADNWNDLDAALDIPINVDENGNKVPSNQTLVWSGTETNGNISAQSGFKCNNWTSADDIYGHSGSSISTNYYWTNSGYGRCWQQARLYCFDQGPPTTGPPTPSPSPSPPPAGPQASGSCGTGLARATGLVSTPQFKFDSKFGTTGACIIDPKATFVPFKIPTFEDLKSTYYTQSKAKKTDATPSSGEANQGTLRSALNSSDTILFRGSLRLNGDLGGSPKTAVVFVDGNLSFDKNFIFGDNNSGLVFVVGGNVNIDSLLTQIDAVIVSSGIICTAFQNSSCPADNITTQQLVINGSLISLNEAAPIKFRRKLTNNTQPAEKINHQVKYLVILRNMLSDTLQKWSEIP